MKRISPYLKRFAAWVTALPQRYRSDLFLRTTIHIVAAQAAVVLLCVTTFWMTLQYTHSGLVLFGMVFFLSIGFGLLLGHITLRPARENVRLQKLFVSNIAHELRTPLSTIKTSSEVALLDPNLPPLTAQIFAEIGMELDRISQIINNLLSLNILTRPERMHFRNTDLGQIVEDVVRRHRDLAHDRDIKITTKLDAHRTVWGNTGALEQVVTNLLKNALSYTPKDAGGVVTLSVQPDYHGMIVLAISDNGIGIAQEDLFHIFEPFYRADTSRVRQIKKTGSGLGLMIVNEIVRVHHGKITIQSTLKRGSTIVVELPAGERSDSDKLPGASAHSVVALDFTKGFEHSLQK